MAAAVIQLFPLRLFPQHQLFFSWTVNIYITALRQFFHFFGVSALSNSGLQLWALSTMRASPGDSKHAPGPSQSLGRAVGSSTAGRCVCPSFGFWFCSEFRAVLALMPPCFRGRGPCTFLFAAPRDVVVLLSAHLGAALFTGAVDTQCQSRGGWERGFSTFWGLPVPAALWGAFGSWLLSCAVGRLGTLPSNLSREPRMPRSAAGAPR